MKLELAKRTSRISSRERSQNRRIDQSLMDLVITVATDLENEGVSHSEPHPDFSRDTTPQTGGFTPVFPPTYAQDPPPGRVVLHAARPAEAPSSAKSAPEPNAFTAASAEVPKRAPMVWTHETGWLPADEYNLSPREYERRIRKRSLVKVSREKLEKLKVYFSQEDLQIIRKVAGMQGKRPDEFVAQATLKLLAELGLLDVERCRMLLVFR